MAVEGARHRARIIFILMLMVCGVYFLGVTSAQASGYNAITNGDFETGTFDGWVTVNYPGIQSTDPLEGKWACNGTYYAFSDHDYDYFFQSLSHIISQNSRFEGAMIAAVAISDSNWRETELAVTKTGMPVVYLHYRLQSTQPPDTSTDKYILIGTEIEIWYVWNRSLQDDLVAKGMSAYLGGTVTLVMCRQDGLCRTGYDALALTGGVPSTGSPGGSPGYDYSVAIVFLMGLGSTAALLVTFELIVSIRRRSSSAERFVPPRSRGRALRSSREDGSIVPEETPSEERISPIPALRKCLRCGASPTSYTELYCWNCGARFEPLAGIGLAAERRIRPVKVGACIVCGSEFRERDVVSRCPHCGNMGHRAHLLEWLHVKSYCPSCGHHLNEQDLQED